MPALGRIRAQTCFGCAVWDGLASYLRVPDPAVYLRSDPRHLVAYSCLPDLAVFYFGRCAGFVGCHAPSFRPAARWPVVAEIAVRSRLANFAHLTLL